MTKRTMTARRAEKGLEKRKRIWMVRHELDRCILSARPDPDLVHLRDMTGAAMKPEPWRTLPLDRALHRVQETAGATFWIAAGLPEFERQAQELHAAFLADDYLQFDARLSACHDFANLDYLEAILRKAA